MVDWYWFDRGKASDSLYAEGVAHRVDCPRMRVVPNWPNIPAARLLGCPVGFVKPEYVCKICWRKHEVEVDAWIAGGMKPIVFDLSGFESDEDDEDNEVVCDYCHEFGHATIDCPERIVN